METLRAPSIRPLGDVAAATAWALDVEAFHAELVDLLRHRSGPLGTGPLRERATALWQDDDPVVRTWVGVVPVDTPEDWAVGFEDQHLGQWYRILMAGHLRPARAAADPATLANRLPDLGWSPAEARRVARGRPLHTLARSHADPATATAVGLVLSHGCKGWLDPEDLRATLQHLESLDRRAFRRHQDLVPVCEDLWAAFAAALDGSEHALLLPPHGC